MKSLKKTLSLVLVIVMVMGMFGAAGAAYTDEASIQYKEAVNVMTGIGAIEGDAGAFSPKDNLTRAQAAKMVTYATLGAKLASSLSASKSTFTDVPVSHWALGSIEYLVTKGIINGRGDGTFDPNGKVTGYELGKMLLASVGFNKKGEYDGEGWTINVAIDAGKIGLFEGSKAAKLSDPATREEAALYSFNGIKYSPAGNASKYNVVDAADKVLSTWDSFLEAYLVSNTIPNSKVVTVKVNSGSISETVYGLVETTQPDALGRPAASVWTYNNKIISTVVTTAPAKTYSTIVKTGTIYKDLGLTAPKTVLGTSVYTNGTAGATTANDVVLTIGGAAPIGGNGVVTEVYVDAKGQPDRIVMIQPTFGQVTSVTTGRNSVGSAYTKYVITTLTAGVASTVEGLVYTSALNNEKDTIAMNGAVKGDFVTYFNVKGVHTTVAPVTLVTGKLTSSSSATMSCVIEGTTYGLSSAVNAVAPTAYNVAATYAIDSMGFVLGSVSTVVAGANLIYLAAAKDAYVLNGNVLDQSVAGSIIRADGTTETVTLAKIGSADATVANSTAGLYSYTLDTKGAYKLLAVADTTITNVELDPKSPVVVANSKYANTATKYVFLNYVDKTTVYAGTVNIITGFNNIAHMNGVNASYIDANKDGIVETVFITNKTVVGTVTNYAFWLGTGTTTGTATGGTVTSYDFIVNGAKTTIDNVTFPAKATAGMYTIGADNAATAVSGEQALVIASNKDGMYGTAESPATIMNNNGILLLATSGAPTFLAPVASTVPVYTFDKFTGGFEVGTAADLTSVTGYIIIAQNGTAVTGIYVIA